MSHDAFNLLARPFQHILWDMDWKELRPIQVEAIHDIIQRDYDLVISARTAGGKTEAAFLPILSLIHANPKPSIQAIYIGPLKALINDQFRRLEDLCRRAEIAVHRWHGDVEAGKKKALLKEPSGVLLITPESVESLFVNHSTFLPQVFEHLQFVVIDEVHAFVGCERGTHLRSLLFRLQHVINHDFRIVALSATLGDAIKEYSNWLRPDHPERIHPIMLDPKDEQKRILYRLHGYMVPRPQRHTSRDGDPGKDHGDGDLPAGVISDMHRVFTGTTSLVFANSREDVEHYADSLNEYGRQIGKPAEFLVHHGSLSKEIREHAEKAMRSGQPHTTLCSSTLELGIDIGNVGSVGQIGPPWSVGSLVQRLGRSGRGEGEPQVMRVFVIEHEADANSRLVDRLYPDLLRAIANTELMLQYWVEPPRVSTCDLSTMTQQILSILAQTGGIRADRLHAQLVSHGAFRRIEQSMFVGVLRSLAANALVEQMPTGDLILAPKGEQVVGHYSFYSAFATPVEYTVVFKTSSIGRLPSLSLPREHDHLLLAARRWEVVSVDHDRCEILVVPAQGRKAPRFLGSVGEIHPRTRQMMREVLLSGNDFPYLNETATELLRQARQTAQTSNFSNQALVTLGKEGCLWFTWTGTVIQRTLCLMAELAGLEPNDQDIAIQFKSNAGDVLARYGRLLSSPPDARELTAEIREKRMRKFDEFLSDDLLTESLARDAVDVSGACRLIESLLAMNDMPRVLPRTVVRQVPTKTPSRPLSEVEFVAFDLETTGFSPTACEIVEIGAIRFRLGDGEIAQIEQLIDPGCSIPRAAMRVHGINDAMVRGKPRLCDVLPRFLEFLGGADTILLAHNATFDISFLRQALIKTGVGLPQRPVVDTLSLARRCIQGLPSYSLENLASYLGIAQSEQHRALADARRAMLVFSQIVLAHSDFPTEKTLYQAAPLLSIEA
ncbi:MAG: exonuclease domain-containing protein [Thermoguttaceae bacterium]